MHFTPKPHVSPALAQLRYGVTACALAVGACALMQLLVFGFVHFTEARWLRPAPKGVTQPLAVVAARPAGGTAQRLDPGAVAASPTAAPTAGWPEMPRVLSEWDSTLRVMSDFAVAGGTIASVSLALLVFLGVAVAAGSSVPGVERAVSAASWSVVLGAGCVPWKSVMPSVPFPGVFSGYEVMTGLSAASEGGAAGAAVMMYTICLLMPLAAVGAAIVVGLRFREGVSEGIIVTSVSEVDERLEREMAGIRKRGVSGPMAPRSVAALNQAIGDRPEVPVAAPPAAASVPAAEIPAVPVPAGTARRAHEPGTVRTARSWLRRLGEPDPGDALKRPI